MFHLYFYIRYKFISKTKKTRYKASKISYFISGFVFYLVNKTPALWLSENAVTIFKRPLPQLFFRQPVSPLHPALYFC